MICTMTAGLCCPVFLEDTGLRTIVRWCSLYSKSSNHTRKILGTGAKRTKCSRVLFKQNIFSFYRITAGCRLPRFESRTHEGQANSLATLHMASDLNKGTQACYFLVLYTAHQSSSMGTQATGLNY